MNDEQIKKVMDDSGEDLLAKLKAQRAMSKSGVEKLKATRFASQQSVQQRTLRTQAVIEDLRREEEEREADEAASSDLPATQRFEPED